MSESAETFYLFRHAVLREAAYQLMPPSARNALHGLAVEAYAWMDTATLRPWAGDVADHARHAGITRADDERRLRRTAAEYCRDNWDNHQAAEHFERLCELCGPGHAEFAQALLGLGAAHDGASNPAAGVAATRRALAASGDDAMRMKCLQQLATQLRETGVYTEAEQCAAQAGELATALADHDARCRALMTQSSLARISGRAEQSIEVGRAALAVAQQRNDPMLVATAKANLGIQQISVGNYTQSLDLLEDAALEHRSRGNRASLVQVLAALGAALIHFERWEEGVKVMHEALEQARAIGARRSEGIILANLSVAMNEQMRYAEGIDCCERALEIHREMGNAASASFAYANLSGMHSSLGQLDRAAADALAGLHAAASVGNLPNELYLHAVLGRVRMYQGRLGGAQACFRDGLQRANQGDAPMEHAILLNYLATLLLLTGESAEAETCMAHAFEKLPFERDTWDHIRYLSAPAVQLALIKGDTGAARRTLQQARESLGDEAQFLSYFQGSVDALQECEAARAENRPSVLWQGALPDTLKQDTRRALLAWAQETSRGQQTAASNPAALAAIGNDLPAGPTPDWTGKGYLA